MRNGRIRTAIVGFGISGELSHAYGLLGNPEFEIVAVCDLSNERRVRAKELLGCRTYKDHIEMLATIDGLDLAAIVTRSDTHCSVACDFLNAGVHTLITKPWVTNESEAKTLVEAQQKSGKQIFPWVPMYWSPEYEMVKNLVSKNAIGDVFMIRRHITLFQKREDWQTKSQYGGGCLLNWGSHIVHPILGIAQSPVRSVTGQLQQVIDQGDVEDNFLATIEFENGTRAIAEYTQAIEGLPSFMVQGTTGMIVSDGSEITLIQKNPANADSPHRSTYPVQGKRFGDEVDIYRDVANSLTNGENFKASVMDAYTGTVVLEAIKQSHQLKRTVEFPKINIPFTAYS